MPDDATYRAVTRSAAYYDPALAAAGARVRRISWGAVFGGFIVALTTQVVLTVLGLGIGLATIEPASEGMPSGSALGMGALIWLIVSSLVALFAGGAVAGRLAGVPVRMDGALHGVLAWCLLTVLSLLMISTAAGRLLGMTSNLVSGAVSAVGQGVAAVVPDDLSGVRAAAGQLGVSNSEQIRREFRELLRQTGKPALQPGSLRESADQTAAAAQSAGERAATQPARADEEAERVLDTFLRQLSGTARQVDRQAVVNVLVARTDMSRTEAEQTVDNWVQTGRQAMAQVNQTVQDTGEYLADKAPVYAEKAASTASSAALWSFVAMLLGVLAAAGGGWLCVPRRLLTEQVAATPMSDRPART